MTILNLHHFVIKHHLRHADKKSAFVCGILVVNGPPDKQAPNLSLVQSVSSHEHRGVSVSDSSVCPNLNQDKNKDDNTKKNITDLWQVCHGIIMLNTTFPTQ